MGIKSKRVQSGKEKIGVFLPKNFCPICQKAFKNILKHFTLKHEFANMEALEKNIIKTDNERKKQEAFGKFISDLNKKLSNKEITINEWKRLRDNWQFM